MGFFITGRNDLIFKTPRSLDQKLLLEMTVLDAHKKQNSYNPDLNVLYPLQYIHIK